jgi:hypothetical protein
MVKINLYKWAFPILLCAVSWVWAQPKPVEIHDRLVASNTVHKQVALKLDACSGKFDDDLIDFLIRNRIWTCLMSRTMARTIFLR